MGKVDRLRTCPPARHHSAAIHKTCPYMDIDVPCTCDIDGEDGVGGKAEVVEEGAEVHLGQAGGQHLHPHHHNIAIN